jgi:hypothetical protein
MDQTLTGTRTFTIDGRSFVQIGESAFELLRDGAATIGTSAVGGAALASAALYIADAPAIPVSREDAMRLGSQERLARESAVAKAHGKPVALPEASPFVNEAFVSHLPTQAELDRGVTISPRAEPGAPPTLEARSPRIDLANARDKGATKAEMDKCRPGGFKGFETQAGLEQHLIGQGKYAGTADEKWELHHLVEQGRGSRAFGSQAVQNEANGIYLPEDVHRAISTQMTEAYTDARTGTRYSHYRDYVEKLPYDQQRNIGMRLVRESLNRTNAPEEVREIVEKELKQLDHAELREFCKPMTEKSAPDPSQLQPAIDQHNDSRQSRLPDARDVAPWDGTARVGTFLDLGNGQVAQHQGRGNYAVMDVQRDLGGVQPPIGQYTAVAQIGQAQGFQLAPPSMEMGISR